MFMSSKYNFQFESKNSTQKIYFPNKLEIQHSNILYKKTLFYE